MPRCACHKSPTAATHCSDFRDISWHFDEAMAEAADVRNLRPKAGSIRTVADQAAKTIEQLRNDPESWKLQAGRCGTAMPRR